jgi:mono/diheme cytochrome c family protein
MRTLLLTLILCPALAAADAPDPRTLRLWKAKCASCHGEDGKAATDQGKKSGTTDITGAEWQKKFTDDQIKAATVKGIKEKRNGKDVEMPEFKDLRPEQLDALVKHIRSLAAK